MKITKTKLTSLALLIGLMAGANSAVYAAESVHSQDKGVQSDIHHGPKGSFGDHERRDPFAELNLTAAQKQKVKEIFDEHKVDRKDVFADMQKTKQDLNKLIASDDYSESKAKDIINDGSEKLTDVFVHKATIDHEVYKILTPEQKEKFVQLLDKSYPGMQGPKHGHKMPPKDWKDGKQPPRPVGDRDQKGGDVPPPAPAHE